MSTFPWNRLAETRSTSPDITVFHAWSFVRFIEIQNNLMWKKLHRTNQGSNFLGGSSSNWDNVRAPIQFERESQPQHLRRWFFLKNRPIHFHINSTSVIRLVKWNQIKEWRLKKISLYEDYNMKIIRYKDLN